MVGFVLLGVAALLVLVVLAIRALQATPSDPVPELTELVGALATVVTPIPDDGIGSISVTAAGHRLKLDAVADSQIRTGTTVVVLDAGSDAAVLVAESGF